MEDYSAPLQLLDHLGLAVVDAPFSPGDAGHDEASMASGNRENETGRHGQRTRHLAPVLRKNVFLQEIFGRLSELVSVFVAAAEAEEAPVTKHHCERCKRT